MKLSRIRIEQVRQFRRPFELAGLESGLNLFTGPNEAGKSTVVRAIRAAFFERHRSSGVDDLVPYGDTAASPTIEIDFETGAQLYRLRKTFFQRKRFNLTIGQRELDGEEAEQHLAQLLGFEFSGRGASKPEHWGIPGLLWIEQGAGHDIRSAVGHASMHLQKALNQSVGEVASTQGDDIARRIKAERDELLTQAGKPRESYAAAIAQRDALTAELAALDDQIAAYRGHVDRLAALREAEAVDQATRPWEGFQSQLESARQSLGLAEGLALRLQAARESLRRHDEHVKLIQQQLLGHDESDKALGAREEALAAAQEKVRTAAAAQARWMRERDAAAAAYEAATHAVALARQEDWRIELQDRLSRAASQIDATGSTLAQAQAEEDQLAALRTTALDNEVPEGAVAQLKELQARLRELRIRQESASTRLAFSLVGPGAMLAGEALQGEGERLVAAATTLDIPRLGRFTIVPGATDLAQHARDEAELRATLARALQRVGAATLEAAEAREARYRQALDDRRQAERALKLLAPQGTAALKAALAEHRARQAEAASLIAGLPPRAEAAVRPVGAAVSDQEAARSHLDSVDREAHLARTALSTAQVRCETALGERDALKALLASAAHIKARDLAARRLVETRALQSAQRDEVEALEREVASARPDILAQDVQRLERTVAQTLRAANERQSQIALLRGNLEATGAQGLEEARAELAVRADAAGRRYRELALRADALVLVHDLIEGRRREATKRLQAPLQNRVRHYLELLFPGATLDIAEDLSPGALTRPGAGALAAFDTLSFGAREQMGLISRLAYADLLKAAGRPTLVILDDALVHSDTGRLSQMKRVLFDAAQRHQVLLFTCHPHLWLDLGASPRPIGVALSG